MKDAFDIATVAVVNDTAAVDIVAVDIGAVDKVDVDIVAVALGTYPEFISSW